MTGSLNKESKSSHRDLDKRIVRQSGWVALSYGGHHIAMLAAMLVLVRLVDPEAFGVVALTWVVVTVAVEIQGAGVVSALVYKRGDIRPLLPSAFAFLLLSSTILYGAIFFSAPLIADVFDTPSLANVVRIMGILVPLTALGHVPSGLLERSLDFQSRAKADVAAAFGQVGVSVGLAVAGADVWALVWGQITGTAIQTAIFCALTEWRPTVRGARLAVVRELVRYGRFVTGARLLELANSTIDNVIVGRLLGSATLGIYVVAFRVADFPNVVVAQIVGRVMFPVYSLLQEDLARFRRAYMENLQRVMILAVPISVTLIVAAEPVVLGLLGERWDNAITPLRILAGYGLVKAITARSGDVFRGSGRPELEVLFGGLQAVLLVVLLGVLVPRYELTGAAIAMLLAVSVTGIARLGTSLRIVGADQAGFLRALAPASLCALLLAVSLLALVPLARDFGPASGLVLMVVAGGAVYVVATLVFARSALKPMWGAFRGVRA